MTSFGNRRGAASAEQFGWRLGCQAWTLHKFTLFETIDKVASLGLQYIEAYGGQKLSRDQPDVVIGVDSPADVRRAIKQKLADSGVKLVNYGVCILGKDIVESRKTFEFAKDMGIETLVSEPAKDALDTVEKLCEEYEINVALHNHPQSSPWPAYWSPDIVLNACRRRSKRIGACADTGHWSRSGLNPLDCLRKLEGRIISFHFKDLDQLGPDAHDVPWGTGVCNAKGLLTEIHRQKIHAVFSIEYEYNWEDSLPDIAQCVEFFDKTAAALA